ncbi:MAG: hypothetical protein JRF20_09690, partial [Deltaproteobacteria bacterium]|nr:hypothetical protein [Deltaproteobacteria bacterium]
MMSFQSVFNKTLATLVSVFLLCGCNSVHLDLLDIDPPLCLNDPTPLRVLEVKHFKNSMKAHFGLFGLVTWKQPPLKKVLEEQLDEYGGNGIININIKSKISPVDMLLGLPFFPLWFPCTYIVEG